MKKLLTLVFTALPLFLFMPTAFAISGVCSGHGGVNCSAGSSIYGGVVCNDATISSEQFSDITECQNTVPIYTPAMIEAQDAINVANACSDLKFQYLDYFKQKTDSYRKYLGGGCPNFTSVPNYNSFTPTVSDCVAMLDEDRYQAERKATVDTIKQCSDIKAQNLDEGQSFSDVPVTNAHYSAINFVKQQGIVSGYSDGTFKPDNKINRAEFIKILIEAAFPGQATFTYASSYCFKDVLFTDWYSQYVCLAKEKNIISGYLDGSFDPNKSINVVETLKIGLKTFVSLFAKASDGSVYGQPWYQMYLNYAENSGLMVNGWKDDISKEITRGEMAEFIFKIKQST